MTGAVDQGLMAPRDPASRFVASIVDRLIAVAPVLGPSRRLAEMTLRFAGVGGTSSLLYALVVAVAVSGFHVQHDLATVLAFALVTPVNFILHRSFTFHSRGMVRADLVRYLALQGMALVVSLAVMSLCVDVFGLPYIFGVVAAIVLVPVVSFLVMNRWVFALKAI